jgi:hypothetical protein
LRANIPDLLLACAPGFRKHSTDRTGAFGERLPATSGKVAKTLFLVWRDRDVLAAAELDFVQSDDGGLFLRSLFSLESERRAY